MSEEPTQEAYSPDHMKPGAMTMVIGSVMLLIGLGVIYIAFNLDVSIEVPGSLYDAGGRINNTGLMQEQLLLFLSGLALAFAGFLAILAGGIKRVISDAARR